LGITNDGGQTMHHRGEFHVARGVTQGDIPSPHIFNIVVDAVLRYWISEILGQGWLDVSSVFYADDGILTSHEDEVLQGSSDFYTNCLKE
jgi:retron-type reverse transcriptase